MVDDVRTADGEAERDRAQARSAHGRLPRGGRARSPHTRRGRAGLAAPPAGRAPCAVHRAYNSLRLRQKRLRRFNFTIIFYKPFKIRLLLLFCVFITAYICTYVYIVIYI